MKRIENFILQNVGGQNMLVPLGSQVVDMNGMVILNATGRYVWELLTTDCSVDELASGVAEHFDVDRERARADVQTFLDDIARMGLLKR